jgi:hypothetical protein
MEYDIYHDESKEAGYWHGILFVPRPSRATILSHIRTIRKETGCEHPLTLKGIKSYGPPFQCARAAIQLAVAAMMQDTKGRVEKVYVSRRTYDPVGQRHATEYRTIIEIREALKLRFVVFRERDAHRFMDPAGQFLDYAAKVETTFRMGFKGGLHLLFDDDDPATICSIHFDGYEHNQRHVDADRVLGRLKHGLRAYCRIAPDVTVDDRPSDHREPGSQSYEDCQFLQLADLLVGSFRTVLADAKNEVQTKMACPVAELVNKWRAGPARMAKSRWNGGFCISQCYLENGEWIFSPLPAKEDNSQQCFQWWTAERKAHPTNTTGRQLGSVAGQTR